MSRWAGMNRQTGRELGDVAHIRQSVMDILTTPVGSRVMRRDYGSYLFQLVDQPINDATRLLIMAAAVQALLLWEPRITPLKIDIDQTASGVTVALDAIRADTGESVQINQVQVSL